MAPENDHFDSETKTTAQAAVDWEVIFQKLSAISSISENLAELDLIKMELLQNISSEAELGKALDQIIAPYIEFLKSFSEEGLYHIGAWLGEELYTLLEMRDSEFALPETVYSMASILDEAGWMQYKMVDKADYGQLDVWIQRTEKIHGKLGKRTDFKVASIIENPEPVVRKVIAEGKMQINRARLNWNRGQFFQDKLYGASSMDLARQFCENVLSTHATYEKNAMTQEEVPSLIAQAVLADIEYHAMVIEAKRMLATILGMAYSWHVNYSLRDIDAAEKTLPNNDAYKKDFIDPAIKLSNEYGDFYNDPDTGGSLETPREIADALIEHVRHLKLQGLYGEAYALGKHVLQEWIGPNNEREKSRLLILMGEVQIILSQKLKGDIQNLNLQTQASEILESEELKPKQSALAPPILIKQGLSYCRKAMESSDQNIKVAALFTTADAVTTLPSLGLGIRTTRQWTEETWPSIANFGGTNKRWLLHDHFLFFQAPVLAELYLNGKEEGVDADIKFPSGYFYEHFEYALEQVRGEMQRNSTKKGFESYCAALGNKAFILQDALDEIPFPKMSEAMKKAFYQRITEMEEDHHAVTY